MLHLHREYEAEPGQQGPDARFGSAGELFLAAPSVTEGMESPEGMLRKLGFSPDEAKVAVAAIRLKLGDATADRIKEEIRSMSADALEQVRKRSGLSLDRGAILAEMREEGVKRLAGLGLSDEDARNLVDAGFSVDTLKRLGKERALELAGEARKKAEEHAKALADKYGVDAGDINNAGKSGYRVAQAIITYANSIDDAMGLIGPDWRAEGTSKDAIESFGTALQARAAVSAERRKQEDEAQRKMFGEVAAVSAVGGPVGIIVGGLLFGFSELSLWLKKLVFEDFNKQEYVDRAKAAAQALFFEFGLLPPDSALFGNAKDLAEHLEKQIDWYRGSVPPGDWLSEWRKIIDWAYKTDDSRVGDLAMLGWFPFSNLDFQGYLPLEHGGLPGYIYPTTTYGGTIGNRVVPQGIDPQGGRTSSPLVPKNAEEAALYYGVSVEKGVMGYWLVRHDPVAVRRAQACAAAIAVLIARYYHAKEEALVSAAVRSLERVYPVVTREQAYAEIDASDKAQMDEAVSHGADESGLAILRDVFAGLREERADIMVANSGLPYVALGSPETLGQVVEASLKAAGSVGGISPYLTALPTGGGIAAPALFGAGAGLLAASAFGGPVGWAVGGAVALAWWLFS